MIDKSGLKLNRVISPETRYMHLIGAIEESQLMFLLASLKDETLKRMIMDHIIDNIATKIRT
jgi:hypothetical protein